MLKSKVSSEKTTKNTKLQMVGLTRSSSQEVADGYGPSIQKSELAADAKSQGYQLGYSRDIVEPALSTWKKGSCLTGLWLRQ